MSAQIDHAESGMDLRDLLLDSGFPARPIKPRDPRHHWDALRRLAHLFADSPENALQELVEIAVEFCGAESAGISLEEPGHNGELRFRWVAIAGTFSKYLHGTTPRFFSPCGTCLSSGRAQLYRVTKPYYDFLGVTADPITDGMLLPWTCHLPDREVRGTIWAISHTSPQAFDIDDYRLLESLADFAAIAIRYHSKEKALRIKERSAAFAEKANQLAHQVNNPLQSLTNIIYLADQGGPEAAALVRQAALDLASLSGLVKELLELRARTDDHLEHPSLFDPPSPRE